MKKKAGIYQIINRITGKRYIGYSFDLENRKNNHFSKLRHKKHPHIEMQKDFKKYGQYAFYFNVIEYFKLPTKNTKNYDKKLKNLKEKVKELEAIYIILATQSKNPLYNQFIFDSYSLKPIRR